MAKPLHARLSQALANERTPDTQLEQLIAEGGAEASRLAEAHSRASAESIDFALSDEDREAAAASAATYARTAAALNAAIPKLEERLAAKRASDSRRALEAERAAALAERDELAAQFKALVEPAVAAMIDLFRKVEANAERLSRAGVREPNAEAKARGVDGFLGYADSPKSFLQMQIPNFAGRGRVWPIEKRAVQFDYAASKIAHQEAEEKRKTAARKRAEEHARLHGRYRLSTGLVSAPVRLPAEIVKRVARLPNAIADWQDWEGELAHADADELRKVAHLNVERLDKAPPKPEPANIPPAPPLTYQTNY